MKRLYLGIGFLLFASPVFGQTDAEIEDVFWQSVECSSRRQVQAYLEVFPNGRYVAEAQACLEQQGHRVQQPPRRPDHPTVTAQATDFNALVQMAEADCQGRTYRGPRHPSDHSRFHCVNAFFLECRRAQGDEYHQAHRQACAQLQAAGMQCPHC